MTKCSVLSSPLGVVVLEIHSISLCQPIYSISESPPVDPIDYRIIHISPWAGHTAEGWEIAVGQSWHACRRQEFTRLLNTMLATQHTKLEEEHWAGGLRSSCKVAKWNRARGLNFTFTSAAGAEGRVRQRLCPQCQKRRGKNSVYFSQDNKFVLAIRL